MGTETLAGQRYRRGVLWVMTGLGCGRSRVQIPGGEPPFLKVSVSNEIGYKHEVGFRVKLPRFWNFCSTQSILHRKKIHDKYSKVKVKLKESELCIPNTYHSKIMKHCSRMISVKFRDFKCFRSGSEIC